MFSRTQSAVAELEAAVDSLRGRASQSADALLADTLLTLGDAIAEVDRILLELHRELTRRELIGSAALPPPAAAPTRFALVATQVRPL